MNKSRTNIVALLEHMHPVDVLERNTISDAIKWVRSGAELYRGERADQPSPHLVVYFVLVDVSVQRLMLVDHIKAGLWLPTGGHVEPDESPSDAVYRELAEELGLCRHHVLAIADAPLFVTTTRTLGSHAHLDTTLWYVVGADQTIQLTTDNREFRSVSWKSFTDILDTDPASLDPHMHRFMYKLQRSLVA